MLRPITHPTRRCTPTTTPCPSRTPTHTTPRTPPFTRSPLTHPRRPTARRVISLTPRPSAGTSTRGSCPVCPATTPSAAWAAAAFCPPRRTMTPPPPLLPLAPPPSSSSPPAASPPRPPNPSPPLWPASPRAPLTLSTPPATSTAWTCLVPTCETCGATHTLRQAPTAPRPRSRPPPRAGLRAAAAPAARRTRPRTCSRPRPRACRREGPWWRWPGVCPLSCRPRPPADGCPHTRRGHGPRSPPRCPPRVPRRPCPACPQCHAHLSTPPSLSRTPPTRPRAPPMLRPVTPMLHRWHVARPCHRPSSAPRRPRFEAHQRGGKAPCLSCARPCSGRRLGRPCSARTPPLGKLLLLLGLGCLLLRPLLASPLSFLIHSTSVSSYSPGSSFHSRF